MITTGGNTGILKNPIKSINTVIEVDSSGNILLINGENLKIDEDCWFDVGYDPSTKLTIGNAIPLPTNISDEDAPVRSIYTTDGTTLYWKDASGFSHKLV